jgi:pyruvate,water dikinase
MSNLFSSTDLVVPFEHLRMSDVETVGGKNASLGEMISQLPSGVKVPTGFATTAHAFREFLKYDGLTERINARLDALDTEDVRALAAAGAEIRAMVPNYDRDCGKERESQPAHIHLPYART